MKPHASIESLMTHITKKSAGHIPYQEALQLICLLYLTLDILPEPYRQLKLDRATLARLFCELTKRNVVVSQDERGKDGFNKAKAIQPEYWELLLVGVAKGTTILDSAFPHRAHRYV